MKTTYHHLNLFEPSQHFIGARLSDSGNIKCVANNLLGKATSNAQLMIEGKCFIYTFHHISQEKSFYFYIYIYIDVFLRCIIIINTAPPRFDVPESYTDGLIFRHEEVIRLKVPLVAKPAPKVHIFHIRSANKLQVMLLI